MKAFIRQFIQRGLLFAWGGPVVVAIVWLCISADGTLTALTVREAVTGVLSSTLLAFIAAGISVVHQVEKLPRWSAAMIHLLVMYADYILIYLLNGWIVPSAILPFTAIFLGINLAIWGLIYWISKSKVRRMNEAIRNMEETTV